MPGVIRRPELHQLNPTLPFTDSNIFLNYNQLRFLPVSIVPIVLSNSKATAPFRVEIFMASTEV